MSNEVRVRVKTDVGDAVRDLDRISLALGFDQARRGLADLTNSLRDPIDQAVALGESINAVTQIFEDQSQIILDWGDTTANSFGLSQRAFNEFATSLGAILSTAGIKDFADQTIALTERAADMASVFNTEVDDALAALQSGLVGQVEPLRRYGVNLSAAATEARALADTGKETAASLTDQEKAAARLAIIFEQTARVEGDFQATSDQLANAQRVLNATIEEGRAQLVSDFLPAIETGIGLFQQLPPEIQAATASAIDFAPAIAEVGSGFVLMAPAIGRAAAALPRLGAAARAAAGPLGVITVALTAAVAANELFGDSSDLLGSAFQELTTTTDQLAFARQRLTEVDGVLADAVQDVIDKLEAQLAAEREAAAFEQILARQRESAYDPALIDAYHNAVTEAAVAEADLGEEAAAAAEKIAEQLGGAFGRLADRIRDLQDLAGLPLEVRVQLALEQGGLIAGIEEWANSVLDGAEYLFRLKNEAKDAADALVSLEDRADALFSQETVEELRLRAAIVRAELQGREDLAAQLRRQLDIMRDFNELGRIQLELGQEGILTEADQNAALAELTASLGVTTDVFGDLNQSQLLAAASADDLAGSLGQASGALGAFSNQLGGFSVTYPVSPPATGGGTATGGTTSSGGTSGGSTPAPYAGATVQEQAEFLAAYLGISLGEAQRIVNSPVERAKYPILKQRYGYQFGTDFVPGDMWAFLHRGEAVIPADANRWGDSGGRGWTQGDVVINIQEAHFADRTEAAAAGDMGYSFQRELRSRGY